MIVGTSIFAWFSYSLPIEERLRLIRSAGFDAVILWWGAEDRHSQPELARKAGLEVENIHAPFANTAGFWLPGDEGDAYRNDLLVCIDDCAKYEIPTVVIHPAGFKEEPALTQAGLERIKRLVDRAEAKGVNLAFENLTSTAPLDYIFTAMESERVGFCYDSGHENAFHPQENCLEKYGSRLFSFHLDDNFGNGDTHLLPFDGTVNWEKFISDLRSCRPVPFLSLEVDFNRNHPESRIYDALSAEQFLTAAQEKAGRLMQMMNI